MPEKYLYALGGVNFGNVTDEGAPQFFQKLTPGVPLKFTRTLEQLLVASGGSNLSKTMWLKSEIADAETDFQQANIAAGTGHRARQECLAR